MGKVASDPGKRKRATKDWYKGFRGKIVVEKREGDNWNTYLKFKYKAKDEEFEVAKGSGTDFASEPRVMAWFVPRAGASVPPAILHDDLWRNKVPAGVLTHREADGILRQALRLSGAPLGQRWVMWAAVRWGALLRRNGWREWWKDFPLVAFWTVLASPFLLPPAVVVGVSLLCWQVVEGVIWLLVRPFSRKQVNKPNVSVRT